MRSVRSVAVAVVFFVLGAAFQRYYDSRTPPIEPPQATVSEPASVPAKPAIQFEREPLWAYGFETPATSTDTAPPQAPPTRNLRPNEDPAEQTRARQARGSRASYSLVDVRDGHNVIDWFPQDHPSPMPPIIKTGPAAVPATQTAAAVRAICPTARDVRKTRRQRDCQFVLHASATGLPQRAAAFRGIPASRTPTR